MVAATAMGDVVSLQIDWGSDSVSDGLFQMAHVSASATSANLVERAWSCGCGQMAGSFSVL